MTLTLIVAAIVLVTIVLVGAIAYWIDEAEEPLEHGERKLVQPSSPRHVLAFAGCSHRRGGP
jgi:hypothetical protein